MNIEQLINMILRRATRRLVNRGVDAGIDYAARRGRPDEVLTPEERRNAKAARQAARRAKQGAKIVRRMR